MFCIIGGNKKSCIAIEELVRMSSVLDLIGSFNDAESLESQFLKTDGYCLIFIDIDTIDPGILDILKNHGGHPNIIMISSSDQYALKAFDLNIIDYLVKPVVFARFSKAIDKASRYYSSKEVSNKADNQIFIKKGSTLVKLKVNDIVFIEALENYVTLNTVDDRFLIHFTMKGIESQLPSGLFLRIHRSYIVNKSMIQTIGENTLDIIIRGSVKALSIGKSYRDVLMNEIKLMNRK